MSTRRSIETSPSTMHGATTFRLMTLCRATLSITIFNLSVTAMNIKTLYSHMTK
jgi:hypothetical protein